jgi:murein DD-endopeptidase MepM/ murein hydrolase activator NlpD
MTKKETAFPCSPAHSISPLKLISYTALAIFSLLLVAPAASAQTKQRHARTRVEERPRRAENKKQPKVRETAARRVSLISKPVKVSSKPAPPPAIRKTVIVSEKQANNRPARPALVNDIVIISEAPVSSHLPATVPGANAASNMPSIWPVAGAIRGGFGVRRNPFGGSGSEFHKGQDISAPMGTPVIATADGVITIAGWQRGYGRVVYIDHGNGLTTRYGHLSRIDVIEGQTIRRGEQLGLVGSTGRSTGPHLHYEVRMNGQPLNPIPYLPQAPQVAPVSGLE